MLEYGLIRYAWLRLKLHNGYVFDVLNSITPVLVTFKNRNAVRYQDKYDFR